MRNRLIWVLALALALMTLVTGCGSKDVDALRVGMEAGYAPFNWTQLDDANGAVPIEGSAEYAGGYDCLLYTSRCV